MRTYGITPAHKPVSSWTVCELFFRSSWNCGSEDAMEDNSIEELNHLLNSELKDDVTSVWRRKNCVEISVYLPELLNDCHSVKPRIFSPPIKILSWIMLSLHNACFSSKKLIFSAIPRLNARLSKLLLPRILEILKQALHKFK